VNNISTHVQVEAGTTTISMNKMTHLHLYLYFVISQQDKKIAHGHLRSDIGMSYTGMGMQRRVMDEIASIPKINDRPVQKL
jgi:hypothetical protein